MGLKIGLLASSIEFYMPAIDYLWYLFEIASNLVYQFKMISSGYLILTET